jgi:putative redox protein
LAIPKPQAERIHQRYPWRVQTKLIWKERMQFSAQAGEHDVLMDAKPPLGQGKAQSPKQLLLAALCGCTAMDVVALLRKHRQDMRSFEVTAEATTREGVHPAVFTDVSLAFRIQGTVDPAVALEAARLSQTQYCGVSAMLSRAVPIRYEVFVNGVSAGQGQAQFPPTS